MLILQLQNLEILPKRPVLVRQNLVDPRTKTFNKRHPPVMGKSSPNHDSSSSIDSYQASNKNVRFDMSSDAAIAAHDYRVAHATRKAIKYTSELHKTLAVRSGLRNTSSSSGVSSSPTRSSPLSSSEEEQEVDQRSRARSPKKYPAPPPPPPPPLPMMPKSSKGID